PDIDRLYMDFVVRTTGHGGWPMTVFCTPEGKPFYGGTYFPPAPRHGLPSFPQILQAVGESYRTRHDDVLSSAAAITAELNKLNRFVASEEMLTGDLLGQAFLALSRNFDAKW